MVSFPEWPVFVLKFELCSFFNFSNYNIFSTMSQMNVLCCYSCKMFQVHMVKKARKWQCKLCNAKQSIQKVYFQGSGKDCRLHVQHLNYLKADDSSFSLHSEEDSNYNTTNIAQELDVDKSIKNNWATYLGSLKKESLSNDSAHSDHSFDNICKVEDMITKEKTICNIVNNDSCNFEITLNDFQSENIVNETKYLCSTDFSYDSSIEDKCNLQDSGKSRDHNDAANIFETYSELDDPLF